VDQKEVDSDEVAFDAHELASARDRAADARDRAAEAPERHATESVGVDEVMLALRGLRISGAYARQEAALLRGAAEVDREQAAAFWHEAAARRRAGVLEETLDP
jgi:hypothetical protein